MGMVREELRRAFFNRSYLVAQGIACTVSLLQVAFVVIPDLGNQSMYLSDTGFPLSVYNRWIGGCGLSVFPGLFFFLIPLLVCVPFSGSFYYDDKTGFSIQVASRSSSMKYCLSKAFACFLAGATVAVLPLALNFYVTCLFYPLVPPDPSSHMSVIFAYSMLSDLFYSNVNGYIAFYFVLIGVTSGLLACVPLVLSNVFSNGILTTCSSFFLCVIANYLFGKTGDYLHLTPISFMRPDQPLWGLDFANLAATIAVFFVAVMVGLIVTGRRHEYR